MKKALILSTIILSLTLLTISCGQRDSGDADGKVTLRFNTDSIGKLLEIHRELAREFEAETGIAVEFLIGPDSATERLVEYQRFLRARSADVDIYQVDVIWPGVLAEHFADLSTVIDGQEFFPAIIENNTINNRLVAAPLYADAPMLYYRRDLLEKYGFNGPPRTWDELSEMALRVQQGERAAGNRNFYGFVFQGAAYEGLTCNALEWQMAEGGGRILSETGQPEFNTPGAIRAFNRARQWVQQITPSGILTYMEEDSLNVFQQGNALFLRNWPYAYAVCRTEGSPVRDSFGVALLPEGEAGSAATLGGWGLSVSQYSRHQEEAKQFVAFLTSHEAQIRRAAEGGYLATRLDVYEEAGIHEEIPYFPLMQEVFANAVARPSDVAGRYYNEISALYYTAVHEILNGDRTTEESLRRAEETFNQRFAQQLQ